MSLKKKLLKGLRVAVSVAVFSGAGILLGNHINKKLDDSKAAGCTELANLTINPLVLPQCRVVDGKLILDILAMGLSFDVATGERVSE